MYLYIILYIQQLYIYVYINKLLIKLIQVMNNIMVIYTRVYTGNLFKCFSTWYVYFMVIIN